MEDKDEYIASLLLSLFLMQGEIDRLNETLDLARKGELVYIKNPQIDKLKAENERLKEELATYGATGVCEVCSDKANKLADKYLGCLQEIKEIAKAPSPYIDNLEIKSATEVGYDYAAICNELEKRLHKVLELITKAESEGEDE